MIDKRFLARALAATCLAACAVAHAADGPSSVTVFGILDEYAGRVQNAGQTAIKAVNSGGLITSRIGFLGSEDLGGGYRANFSLIHLLRVDTGASGRFDGDAFWGSRSTVGISGPFGAIDLGRMNAPMFYSLARYDSFELANLAPVFTHTYPGGQPLRAPEQTPDSAINNSAIYTSPTVYGFKTTLQYGLAETTPFKGRFGYSLDYAVGAFQIGLAGEQIKSPLQAGETKQTALMGGTSYDFGVVKLFGIVKNEKQTTLGNKYRMYDVGARVPFGLLTVIGTFTRTKLDQAVLPSVTRDTSALGLDYYLSKRTDLYAVATHDKVTRLSNGNTVVAGIRHKF